MNKKGDSNIDPVITAILTLIVIVVLIFFVAQVPAVGNVLKEKVNDIVDIFKDVFKVGVSKEKMGEDENAKVVFNEVVGAFEKCAKAKSDNCKCVFDVSKLNEDYKIQIRNYPHLGGSMGFKIFLYDKNNVQLGEKEFLSVQVKFATAEIAKEETEPAYTTMEEMRKSLRYVCDFSSNGVDLLENGMYIHLRNDKFVLEDENKKIIGYFVEEPPEVYKNGPYFCFVTDKVKGAEEFYKGLESCK